MTEDSPGTALNFQSRGVRQGATFESLCRDLLRDYRFQCLPKKKLGSVGIEIDIPALTPGGREIWFNCKGSWYGGRPGLLRTDTLKKAILEGYFCKLAKRDGNEEVMSVLLTSHLPKPGSVGDLWLNLTKGDIFDDVICLHNPNDLQRLSLLARLLGDAKDQLEFGSRG